MFYDYFIRRRLALKYVQYLFELLNKYIPSYISKSFIKKYETWTTTLNIKVASNTEKYKNYKVFEIENFLSNEDCDAIIKLAKHKGLIQSTIINDHGKNIIDLDTRKSYQSWLEDSDNEIINNLSITVSKITNIPVEHQEHLQVVSYEPSNYYKAHFDASYHPNVLPIMNYGFGPRVYTFIIYLNDDFEGGETEFPKIGLKVKPAKGKAILFQNIDNSFDLIPESMHGGCPVTSGTKWIANKWIRVWPIEMKQVLSHFQEEKNKNIIISPNNYKYLQTILYHNILSKNFPLWFYDKNNFLFLEIENFINLDKISSLEIIDYLITNQVSEVITVPMDNPLDHFEKIKMVTNNNNKPIIISPYTNINKQRFFSIYIFANDDYEGGTFYFPNIAKTIIPKKGKAIMFMSIDNSLSYDPRSLCIIEPVLTNKQIILEKHINILPNNMKFILDNTSEWIDHVYDTLKDKTV